MMNIHADRTVPIEFAQVVKAYHKVRHGGKAVGIDNECWTTFEKNVEKNLYVVWNRLSSGSYFPQAVREAEIPKKDGTMRKLGIPTLRDRIAQQVVKDYMEKRIDVIFHEDSYGYRPLKNAQQALKKVRDNSYIYDWVIDMDIKKFFDEIDHELLLKAVEHLMSENWVKMYVERWLKMPIQKTDGNIEQKQGKGTPQGGVISPLLANLYLHFTLDAWLNKHYPEICFVRYADDVVIHCNSKEQAEQMLIAIKDRLKEVKLEIKEEKTRIAYCKDYRRTKDYDNVKFEFLGFSFQPRARRSKRDGKAFSAFSAEISTTNQSRIIETIRELPDWNNTCLEMSVFAKLLNSKIRGWVGYYSLFSKRRLRDTLIHIDLRLIKWIMKKYKMSYRKGCKHLNEQKNKNPHLFFHWEVGIC